MNAANAGSTQIWATASTTASRSARAVKVSSTPSDESEQTMLDLDFYAALPYGALYRESQIHSGVWAWAPKYCLLAHSDNLEHDSQLNGADWLPIGALDNKTLENASVLFSQLGQVRL